MIGAQRRVGGGQVRAQVMVEVARDPERFDRRIAENQAAKDAANGLACGLVTAPAWAQDASAQAAAIREQAKLKAANRTSTLFVNTAQLPPAPEALKAKVDQLQERITALRNVQGAAAKLRPAPYAHGTFVVSPTQRCPPSRAADRHSGCGFHRIGLLLPPKHTVLSVSTMFPA